MNLHKHQLYLLEQHSESFKSWSAIIRINTINKSSIMKLGLATIKLRDHLDISLYIKSYKRLTPCYWKHFTCNAYLNHDEY